MRFVLRRWPRSLAAQLLAISVGSLLLVMALIAGGTAVVMTWPPAALLRDDLEDNVQRIERGLRFDAEGRLHWVIEMDQHIVQMYDGLPKDMAYRVTDAAGATLLASPPGIAQAALQRLPFDAKPGFTAVPLDDTTLQVLRSPVRRDQKTYVIQVARSERLQSVLRSNNSETVLWAGAVTMVLGVLIFCVLVLWTVRRMVQPLRDVSAVAAAIDPSNLTARLDAQRLPSEMTPLIEAFNHAIERLERGYKVQQELLASAAHELKTPLSLIRAEIEAGTAPGRDRLLKDVDFMARQVHQLLHLAEASETQNYAFATVDAAAVVADAIAQLARLAERAGVRLDLHRPPIVLPVRADEGALFILVKNLVENAIQHASRGGVVTVRLDAEALSVRNVGPRIAPDDLPKLFTRFWRGSAVRHDGAGLGLAICEEIALAHGWTLSAHDVPDPAGAEFRVALGA